MKKLDNKQRITDRLLQQISETNRPVKQVENTIFNGDVIGMLLTSNMKDIVKDVKSLNAKVAIIWKPVH